MKYQKLPQPSLNYNVILGLIDAVLSYPFIFFSEKEAEMSFQFYDNLPLNPHSERGYKHHRGAMPHCPDRKPLAAAHSPRLRPEKSPRVQVLPR